MTDLGDGQSQFHDGLYKQAISEIGTLKEKLPEDAFASLAREVIRRLSVRSDGATNSVAFPSDAKIDALARALLEPDADAGIAFVEKVRAQGASVETVYLAYLAEAARTLGKWWEEDVVSFPEVTVATGHIYAVMRGLKPLFRPSISCTAQPSAFFTTVPGETHLLGVSMAADLFRKQGWDIALKRGLDHDGILHYAETSRTPVIGLSAAGEHALVPLSQLVVALRISVPDVSIMVSGAILKTSPKEVEALGVDVMASDIEEALAQARGVWDQTVKSAQAG